MFPELNSILSTTPENCAQGEFVLVSESKTDASFLIHHFLSFYLRAGRKVCFLGLGQSFSHYSTVSQRLGVSLTQAREKGQLVFLEGLKDSVRVLLQEEPSSESHPLDFLRSPHSDLRGLFEFVRTSVTAGEGGEWGPPVLIVDDLTALLSLGVSLGSVQDFSHYCRATVCSRLQGNVVLLARSDEDEEGDEEDSGLLVRTLIHQCSLALRVQGLSTGYCRDIHGQVEVWWRGPGGNGSGVETQRKLFQYKVHDKGASFFARGTSSSVL